MSQYPNQPYGGQPSYGGQPPYGNDPQPGYGQAPGFGQPAYGQPGYGQNPPYQQPQAAPNFASATPPPGYGASQAQPAPKKKGTNPLVWVGLGCGALLLAVLLIIFLVVNANGPAKGNIHQAVTMGKYVATVEGVDCTKKQVQDKFGAETYKASRGQYCLIQVSVTNNSDKSVTMDYSYQKLYVGSDEYVADKQLNSVLVMPNAMFYVDVKPGATQKATVAFDSPSASPDKLKLQVGTYSNVKTAEIKLNG